MNKPLISLKNRRILLGITGGIAAYKALDLVRRVVGKVGLHEVHEEEERPGGAAGVPA